MRFVQAFTAGILAVAFVLPVAAQERIKKERLRGDITKVQPDSKQITVKGLDGKEVTLMVDDDSSIRLKGQDKARLADFKEGMRVVVIYEPKDGKNHVLVMREPIINFDVLKEEAKDFLNTTKEFSYKQKDEYQKKLDANLQRLDERIDDLQDRVNDATPEVRKEAARELEELQMKRKVVQERMGKLKDASEEAWGDLRKGIGEAVDDLERSLGKAASRFEKK